MAAEGVLKNIYIPEVAHEQRGALVCEEQKKISFSEHPHSKKHFEMPKIKKMVLRNLIKATKAPLQLVCLKKCFFLFLSFQIRHQWLSRYPLNIQTNNLIDSHTQNIKLKKKKKIPILIRRRKIVCGIEEEKKPIFQKKSPCLSL